MADAGRLAADGPSCYVSTSHCCRHPMKCPSCRAEVLEFGKFCNHCGAVLAHCCPSCGNGNPPGSNFCSECGTGLTRISAPQSSVDLRARTGLSVSAERRHLTVMFCDLVGSTALSTHLDVEDLRELIRSYQKSVADAVGRFGGFVARRKTTRPPKR